jgi:hypothetical protein
LWLWVKLQSVNSSKFLGLSLRSGTFGPENLPERHRRACFRNLGFMEGARSESRVACQESTCVIWGE